VQKAPERVRSGPSSFFERRPELYALRHETNVARREGMLAEVSDDANDRYAVYEGTPPAATATEDVLPVYSAGKEGPIAVPTGRVFVRLREGVRPDERRRQFADAGFEIEKILPYAPGAAWLRPAEGGVGEALDRMTVLEELPDVVHVEPQMLLERALRDS
jgi:hypothetical protein